MEMGNKDRRLIADFETAMKAIGTRWKPAILYCLIFGGTLRFSMLLRLIPGITHKMLTQRLREMERDGLIEREIFAEVPLRVEYRLSEMGQSLVPLLRDFCHWADARAQDVSRANAHYDSRS